MTPNKRTRSNPKVSFGSNQEYAYSVDRTQKEHAASWYSDKQFVTMRCHAYGLAKTALLVNDRDRLCTMHGNSLRGLEKITGGATSSKRRRNIVRSLVELHRLESSDRENAQEIQATLRKYVSKHLDKARKAARTRALEDEVEAQKVYDESTVPLTKNSKQAIPQRQQVEPTRIVPTNRKNLNAIAA